MAGAGLCLAGSIVVKVFPALLLVYLIARRKLKPVMITGVFLIVLVLPVPGIVFGVMSNQKLLHQWCTTIALPTTMPDIGCSQMIDPRIPKNQSIQAVLIANWLAPPMSLPFLSVNS